MGPHVAGKNRTLMIRRLTLPAFAKVNLYLDVLGKRPDGYHDIVTLFERIDLADRIAVQRIPGTAIQFECASDGVPHDDTNLVVRAAEMFRRMSGWKVGLRIQLVKRIPPGAGLGGGSSDAASTLWALQRMSGGLLDSAQLIECARQLGADVPFFLARTPWAIGTDRGDTIAPLKGLGRWWHLLVTPDWSISTRTVYEGLAGGLTPKRGDVTLLVRALEERNLPKVRQLLFNALEPTVEALYPAMREVKVAMVEIGLSHPCVSGSGSTVFVLCASRAEAEEAGQRLSRRFPRWKICVTATALSSNGRTPEFGSGYPGSSPGGARLDDENRSVRRRAILKR
jgi:4-diphosphocytidyl-2-C-methyl-D-erythritol kinase